MYLWTRKNRLHVESDPLLKHQDHLAAMRSPSVIMSIIVVIISYIVNL